MSVLGLINRKTKEMLLIDGNRENKEILSLPLLDK